MVVVSEQGQLVAVESVNFDEQLPKYGTTAGVSVRRTDRGSRVTAQPSMWLDAVELCLDRLCSKVDMGSVKGCCFGAQQHGLVWWTQQADTCLAEQLHHEVADRSVNNVSQLIEPCLSLPFSVLWQDDTATEDAAALEQRFPSLAARTGSGAYARFMAPLMHRLIQEYPQQYSGTGTVSLVSSFLTSVLLGRLVGLDVGDASACNLLTLATGQYDAEICAWVHSDFRSRLGATPVPMGTALGSIAPFFQHKYGFGADCIVCAGTGDNPAAALVLQHLAANQERRHSADETGSRAAMLSFGTSDTFLLNAGLHELTPNMEYGHIMRSATVEESESEAVPCTLMLCFSNGDLVRKHCRDTYTSSGTWDEWEHTLQQTESPLRYGQARSLFWLYPPIVPKTSRTGVFDFDGTLRQLPPPHTGWTDSRRLRSQVDTTLLSIRCRYSHALVSHRQSTTVAPVTRIYVVGGAAKSAALCQCVADCFHCEVQSVENASAAVSMVALGAVLLCMRSVLDRNSHAQQQLLDSLCSTACSYSAQHPQPYQSISDEEFLQWQNSL